MIRSKELEVLLSRARAAEQKQLASGDKAKADKLEEEVPINFCALAFPLYDSILLLQIQQLRKDLEDSQNGQTMLIDKLIQCCKEVSIFLYPLLLLLD